MAIALTDFNELTPTDAITHLLEVITFTCTLAMIYILFDLIFEANAVVSYTVTFTLISEQKF